MERRFLARARARVRFETRDDDKPRIVGLGAVYYDGTPETEYELWTGGVERILPGAFTRAVKEDDVRGLFNHDSNLVLGRNSAGTMLLADAAEGLAYDITVPDTQIGRDLAESIRRGDVTGSSFSFIVTDETWSKEDGVEIREIKGVQLFDTGPVTFPAYEATTAGVRSADALADARASHDAWQKKTTDRSRRARAIDIAARLAQLGT